ncbi:MAG: DUF4271 domain-containing protein [Prevotellaceae bacterium]|nr:DUF4271 domain-containing protein [Prevotellaceae bacterium]
MSLSETSQALLIGIDVQPIPYTLSGDTLVTSLLLVCFLIIALSLGSIRDYLGRELDSFIYTKDYSSFYKSSVEGNFQLLLCMQSIVMFAILAYSYLGKGNLWSIIGIMFLYVFGRYIIYNIVNWTFFEKKDTQNWNHIFSIILLAEGIMLFPVVLLQVYTEIPVRIMLICTVAIVSIVKIMTFYKQYAIFFRRFSGFLQIILYFCTLEIIPALILYGIMGKSLG